MGYGILPWVLDEAEAQVDLLQARLRVSSHFDDYLNIHFKTVVSTIINEGKMKNAKSNKTAGQPPLVWVNTQLSDTDASDFVTTQRDDMEILNGLMALVGSGYELAFKHDAQAGCWRAYLFNKCDFDTVHFGLSCFASTPRDTIDLLLFKFYRVLGGEWPDPDGAADKPKFG